MYLNSDPLPATGNINNICLSKIGAYYSVTEKEI